MRASRRDMQEDRRVVAKETPNYCDSRVCMGGMLCETGECNHDKRLLTARLAKTLGCSEAEAAAHRRRYGWNGVD